MEDLLIDILIIIINICDTRTKLLLSETSTKMNVLTNKYVKRNLITRYLPQLLKYNITTHKCRLMNVPLIGICDVKNVWIEFEDNDYYFNSNNKYTCNGGNKLYTSERTNGYKTFHLTKNFKYKGYQINFAGVIKRFGMDRDYKHREPGIHCYCIRSDNYGLYYNKYTDNTNKQLDINGIFVGKLDMMSYYTGTWKPIISVDYKGICDVNNPLYINNLESNCKYDKNHDIAIEFVEHYNHIFSNIEYM